MIEKLGIADAVKAKSKFPRPAGFVGTLLTSGEVDIAFQTKPELTTTPGVEVLGPPPGDLGQTNVFAAGVSAGREGQGGRRSTAEVYKLAGRAGGVQVEGFRSGLSKS